MQEREIRAIYDDTTVRVYQAYSPHIAIPALEASRFVSPFKMERMTWIKPSFRWMMYRCGFARKPGQEMVLGMDITRVGFEWALDKALLSNFHEPVHGDYDTRKSSLPSAPVRVQWDPERDGAIEKMEGVRSIQIGLTGEAVFRYVNEWITNISDLTEVAREMGDRLASGTDFPEDPSFRERIYPLEREATRRKLRMPPPA